YGMLLILLLAPAIGIAAISQIDRMADGFIVAGLFAAVFVFLFVAIGFYLLQPNQAVVITLFGDYRGTDRTTGLRWTWPWMSKKKISARANNIISDRIKVN